MARAVRGDTTAMKEERMRGRSMLLLVAGVIAGGCSHDAPTAASEVMSEVQSERVVGAMLAVVAVSPAELTADAIDGALGRLLPSLGDYGAALKSPLLKLKANGSDQAARNDLRRLLEQLDATLPAAYRADLDALRLELSVSTK
jgi:hypothetical protein